MASDNIELTGTIIEVCRGGNFKVRVSSASGGKEHIVMARPSGKIRKFGITIVMGDVVQLEVSPYSLDKGRIIYRNK